MASDNVFQQPHGGDIFRQPGGGGRPRTVDYLMANQFAPQQTLFNQAQQREEPKLPPVARPDVTASGRPEYEQLVRGHFSKFADVASPLGTGGDGDPITGKSGVSSESSGRIAGLIGRQMAAPPTIESTPSTEGPLFQEMSRRGMIPAGVGGSSDGDRMRAVGQKLGLDEDQVTSLRQSNPEQYEQIASNFDGGKAREAMKGMSGAVKAMKEMFDASGQDASLTQIFDSLEQVTQGGINRMKPEKVQGLVRELNNLSKDSLTSIKDLMSASSDAGRMADELGLNRDNVPQAQLGNLAFTSAFRKEGRGDLAAGERSSLEDLSKMDMELRLDGAASPAANQLNATMGLRESDGFTQGSAAEAMSNAIEQGQSKFQDPITGDSRSVEMAPDEWTEVMQQGGVDRTTSEQMLAQRVENQTYGQQFDTSRVVRQLQAETDIAPSLGMYAEGTLEREFARHGLDRDESKKAAKFASQQMASSTLSMDIEDRTDPDKRSELMGQQMRRVVVDGLKARGVDVDKSRFTDSRQKVLGAQVFDAMDAGIEESPNLRKFGNAQTTMDLFDQRMLKESETARTKSESIRRIQESLDDPAKESSLGRMRGIAVEGHDDPGANFRDIEARTFEHEPKDELLRRIQPTMAELDKEIKTGKPDGGRSQATLSEEQKQGRQEAYDFIGSLLRESDEGPKRRLEIPQDKASKEEDRRDADNKEQSKKLIDEKLSHKRLTTPVFDIRGGGDDEDRANLVRQPRQEVAQAVSATQKQGSKRAGDRDAVTINGTLLVRNGQGVILDGKATGLGNTQDENESELVAAPPSRVGRPMALG